MNNNNYKGAIDMMCPGDNINIMEEFKIHMNDNPQEDIQTIVDGLFKEALFDFQFNETEKAILSKVYSELSLLFQMYLSDNPRISHPDTYNKFYNEFKKLFVHIFDNVIKRP
jgi:hypothetical protein